MKSFRDLMDRWPTIKDFASETGIDLAAAYSMYRRDSIRSTHWPEIIRAARKRGFKNVTDTKLIRLQSAKNDNGADAQGVGAVTS